MRGTTLLELLEGLFVLAPCTAEPKRGIPEQEGLSNLCIISILV